MENKKIFLLTVIAGLISYFGFVLLRQLQTTPDIQTFLINYSHNFEPVPVQLQELRNHTLRSERRGLDGRDEPFLIQIGEDIIYHEKK